MHKKLIKIFVLFLIFIISAISTSLHKKTIKCKVLKVIEADEFIVDLNKNNKIDANERIKLEDAIAFKARTNPYIRQNAKELNLSQNDILKIGYIAKAWANEELLNKEIEIYGTHSCTKDEICKVKIYKNKQNYSILLVKNGLGYFNNKKKSENFSFIKRKQIKNNILKISNLNFLIKNLSTKLVHTPNCIHTETIKEAEIFLEKELDDKNNIFCNTCLKIDLNKLHQKLNIPKNKNIYKKSFSKKYNDMDVYFINPLEYQKPSLYTKTEFGKRLIQEINNSKEKIDIALYEFNNQKEIYDALLKAKDRGVKIRAICDSSKDEKTRHQMHFNFIKEFDVVLDKTTSLMHNKFFIFDNKILMTGSSNISPTGSGGYNANIVAFIYNEKVIEKFSNEFEQMYNLKFSTRKKQIHDNSANIKAYFSPKDDIYSLISNLINKAKETIYISAFYLTDKKLINDLIQAQKRGIKVLVILDATSANNFKNRIYNLRKNNILIAVENWGGKNHEKTIAIDNETLIFGSCNFSKNGFYNNDENIIIINNKELTSLYKDYFLFLFNSIDKKFLFTIPRAEGKESINSCYDGIDNNFDGNIDSKDKGCI